MDHSTPAGRSPIGISKSLRRLAVSMLLIAAFSATWNGYQFAGFEVADIFLSLSLGAILVTSILGGLAPRLPGWWWLPTLVLLACTVARFVEPVSNPLLAVRYPAVTAGPGDGFKAALWSLALVGLPLAIAGCTALFRDVPRWTAEAFLAGVTFSSAISLSDFAGVTNISRSLIGYSSISDRQTGLTNHPNTLGLTCVLAAPIAVYLIAERRFRFLASLALVVLLGGVVASGSRGAQAAFPIAILLAAALSPRRRDVVTWPAGLAVPVGLGGLVYLSTIPSDILNQLLRFRGSGGSGQSDSDRTFLARQALSDIREFPVFGVGISHINEAHSIYLQMLSAGGLALTLAMAVYLIAVVRTGWKCRLHEPQLASGLVASIAMWLILGSIQNQLTDRYLYYTVGCVAALAFRHRHASQKEQTTAESQDKAAAMVTGT